MKTKQIIESVLMDDENFFDNYEIVDGIVREKKPRFNFLMMSVPGVTRVVATISLPTKIGDKITKFGEFVLLCTANPNVTFTTAFLNVVSGHITDLIDAEAAAKTRGAGLVSTRNGKLAIVMNDIYSMQMTVQAKVNTVDAVTGITTVTSTGFKVKQHGIRVKPDLEVRNIKGQAGNLLLIAKAAGKRASYQWQVSSNGINWTDLNPSLQAKTTYTGQTSGAKLYFRKRAVIKTGPTSWSQVFVIIVA